MSLTIHQGDILTAEADAVVNPANSFLRHGGGLAAIIDKAAQSRKGEDYRSIGIAPPIEGYERNADIQAIWQYKHDNATAPLIATGNAYATSAGMLPFKRIIHAVGPIWNGGTFYEGPLLREAHYRACAKAYDERRTSIAFPAISCGIFGFPVQVAAYIAIEAVRLSGWADEMEVQFWLFEDAHFEAYSEAAGVAA